MAQAAYDSLIRDIYLSANKGPLRVALGQGSYAPYLRSGDVVLLQRGDLDAARPGDFLGVRDEHNEIRLVRLLEQRGDEVRVFTPVQVETVSPDAVLGRGTHVERGGERLSLDSAQSSAGLLLEQLKTRGRGARRRVRLQASLSGLYWDLIEAQADGVSETGDILTTNRCPVATRYDLVPALSLPNKTALPLGSLGQQLTRQQCARLLRLACQEIGDLASPVRWQTTSSESSLRETN